VSRAIHAHLRSLCAALYWLFVAEVPRPPGGVADVQNSHPLANDAIENLEGIADKRQDPHAGILFNTRSTFRRVRDGGDRIANAHFERSGDAFSEMSGGYSRKSRAGP